MICEVTGYLVSLKGKNRPHCNENCGFVKPAVILVITHMCDPLDETAYALEWLTDEHG